MNSSQDKVSDISICICTYKYPEGLQSLLNSLLLLEANVEFDYEIIVIDNDGAGSARGIVEAIKDKNKNIYYYIESEQGIAQARNLAIKNARGKWLVFVDDDEVVDANWLNLYWHISKNIPADGYFGPVLTKSIDQPPKWLKVDDFFYRPRFKTGTELLSSSNMRTGNTFLKRALLFENQFDIEYGLTGGEDSELFERLLRLGKKFYWCDEALVYEYLKCGRLTFKWLIRRSFRVGITYSLIKKKYNNFYFNFWGLLKALVALFIFAIILPFDLLGGTTTIAKRLRRIAVQMGHICAYLNIKFLEYRRL